MADLKALVTPVFLAVVNYWQLAKLGEEVTLDKFRSDMEAALERAREAAHADPDVERAFERVHRPLVFFIDYMVKEGPFSFKDEWRLMARDFNELSGDEKFFEVLEDVLRYSDKSETLQPFYTMIGLGFDGVYHQDSAKIHSYLQQLSEKLKNAFDHRSEYLTRLPVKKRVAAVKSGVFQKYRILCITGGFAILALLVNITFFFIATADFRRAIDSAAGNAMVFSTGLSTANANLPPIPYDVPSPPAGAPRPVSALPVPPEEAPNPSVQNTAVIPEPPPPAAPQPVSLPTPEVSISAESAPNSQTISPEVTNE